jgi:hypothetical protein
MNGQVSMKYQKYYATSTKESECNFDRVLFRIQALSVTDLAPLNVVATSAKTTHLLFT